MYPNYPIKYRIFIQKQIPFEYHNVGVGSAGNHVITHRYRKKIKELIDKGINPKNICGTIQLSGLARATDPVYEVEFDLPNQEKLTLVLDKDLYFKQSVDILITGTELASQNKRLDIYMNSDYAGTGKRKRDKAVIGF